MRSRDLIGIAGSGQSSAVDELLAERRHQASVERERLVSIEQAALSCDSEVMRRDVHPAELAMPDGTLITAARVFVTDRRLVAFRVKPDRTIEAAVSEPLAQPCSVPATRNTLMRGQRLEVRLANGGTAWINAGAGCGCGSPLKALATPVPWNQRRA